MKQIRLVLEGEVVALNYPASLEGDIEALFGKRETSEYLPSRTVSVEEECGGRFAVQGHCKTKVAGLKRDDCLLCLVGEVVEALITGVGSGVVLHSAAVSWESKGILLPGKTGAGKSCLSAWLAERGFDYLTDECVVLRREVPSFVALTRPLIMKNGASTSFFRNRAGRGSIVSGPTAIFWPQNATSSDQPVRCHLIVFPHFESGAQLRIESLTAAQTAIELTGCNVNARNLPDHGLGVVTSFARTVPAIALRYGSFDQLEEALDALLKLVVGSDLGSLAIRRALGLFKRSEGAEKKRLPEFPPVSRAPSEAPPATPRGEPRKLTIGMATYDDYDGVYFTLQALRMYHPEIIPATEFVVVDNNPKGPCANPMKALEHFIPNYRYVPCHDKAGTAVRNRVFEEASGELVLCMDCHVFIVPGAVRRLIDYCDEHPEANDLLQGPLIYDDLKTFSTQFEPAWREGMFGQWVADTRGIDPDAEAFDIPMQGLGLFACRRSAWPGFNPRFRGFGGEEGYIHEKFRNAGGRTLCLPFLRWMHRFNRPMGVPYTNTWDDRIRNYMIGFSELGWDLKPLKDHFVEFLGPWITRPIFERVEAELAGYGGSVQNSAPGPTS